MASVNDLPKIEGIRDFFVGEIYGDITTSLVDKGYFGDKSNAYYMKSLDITAKARGLVDMFLNSNLSDSDKDRMIEATVNELYKDLADLKESLNAKQL